MKAKNSAKKGSAAWRNWYAKHRDEHNLKRREQYAQDEEKRKAILERQQKARRERPKPESDGRQYRNVGGRVVQVFRVGEVAQAIGKDVQSIRIWERAEKIPKPTIPGGHRYYTEGQLELIKQFSDLMTELRYDPLRREKEVSALCAAIKAQWAHA